MAGTITRCRFTTILQSGEIAQGVLIAEICNDLPFFFEFMRKQKAKFSTSSKHIYSYVKGYFSTEALQAIHTELFALKQRKNSLRLSVDETTRDDGLTELAFLFQEFNGWYDALPANEDDRPSPDVLWLKDGKYLTEKREVLNQW